MSIVKRFLSKAGLDGNSITITNVADPVNAQDVATKNFTSNASNITSGTLAAAQLPVIPNSALANTAVANLSGTNTGDQTITLTGGVTGSGTGSFAATVVTNANLTGDVTSVGNATILTNAAVISKVLTGFSAASGTVSATDSILSAFNKVVGNIGLLTGAVVYAGTWNATTNSPALVSGTGTKGTLYKVTTAGTTTIDGNSQWNIGDQIVFNGTTWDKWDGISSEVLTVAGRVGAVALAQADITGLTTSSSPSFNQVTSTVATGTAPFVVTSTTPVANLSIGGNAATVTTNANLTGVITSSGNATSVASQTGTGSKFVMDTSPTLVTPNIGTPSAGNLQNCTFFANGSMGSAALTTSTTTANQVVMNLPITTYRSAKYQIQVTSGTSYHATEILAIHDGTNVYIVESDMVYSASSLATFDVIIAGGNLELVVTPVNAVTTIKVVATLINI